MGVLWIRNPFFRQESGRGACEKDQLRQDERYIVGDPVVT